MVRFTRLIINYPLFNRHFMSPDSYENATKASVAAKTSDQLESSELDAFSSHKANKANCQRPRKRQGRQHKNKKQKEKSSSSSEEPALSDCDLVTPNYAFVEAHKGKI